MAEWHYLVLDSSAGTIKCELPFNGVTFSTVLSGVGQFTGSVPLEHPAATNDNLYGDREIVAYRDGNAEWNGPITGISASRSSGLVQVTAMEPTFYLARRALEADFTQSAGTDLYAVVRALVNQVTTKTSTTGDGTTTAGSNINAAIPRFNVTTGTSGVGLPAALSISGTLRRVASDVLQMLVDDPTTALDYKMVYNSGSTTQPVQRTLTLGVPLGATLTQPVSAGMLLDYSRTLDVTRTATRVHVIGNNYVKTLQNTASITDGFILYERVFDYTDAPNSSLVDARAADARRLAQPIVRTFTATYTPSGALPYGWCEPGDTINLQMPSGTILDVSANLRVVQITTQPQDASGVEAISLGFNLPLDQLGA